MSKIDCWLGYHNDAIQDWAARIDKGMVVCKDCGNVRPMPEELIDGWYQFCEERDELRRIDTEIKSRMKV